jgi:hypothetical protein
MREFDVGKPEVDDFLDHGFAVGVAVVVPAG